jgi:hypothetical protein
MNFKATAGLLGCLILFIQEWPMPATVANDDSNPYAVISERNVFHLNPLPPPEPPPEAPKADLPKIKLSGFLRIGIKTHALFSCAPKDKKQEPTYYNLTDGEKDGILEVVKIREEKGEVDVINSGTPATLTLKDDTLEPKAPPAKGAIANSERPRGPKPPGGPDQVPGRSAYRFPVQGGGRSPSPFPMPERRARVAQ